MLVHHSKCLERKVLTLVQKPDVKLGREYSIIMLNIILSLKWALTILIKNHFSQNKQMISHDHKVQAER